MARAYSQHGLTTLKAAVRTLGARVIDRRTAVGKALDAWRSDLVDDLGGLAALSTQQLALVDLAVRSKLLLDSLDAWLLQQQALVDRRKRSLLPAVRERDALVGRLQRATWRHA